MNDLNNYAVMLREIDIKWDTVCYPLGNTKCSSGRGKWKLSYGAGGANQAAGADHTCVRVSLGSLHKTVYSQNPTHKECEHGNYPGSTRDMGPKSDILE